MAEPLVSVIVPVHRGERFLAATLDSVGAQSHPLVETIVVDDGSPDRSAEIAAARPDVRLVRRAHAGVAAARNAGLGVARGDLIAFLDQDDEWHPEKLARQAAFLAGHPDVAIALSYMDIVLVPGTPRPDWFESGWLTDPQPGYVPSTWLVRREAFERVGQFDTGYAIACDSDWLARAKDAGLGREMLPDVLARWRVHGANGSYDQETMRREMMRMLRATVARQREGGRVG